MIPNYVSSLPKVENQERKAGKTPENPKIIVAISFIIYFNIFKRQLLIVRNYLIPVLPINNNANVII